MGSVTARSVTVRSVTDRIRHGKIRSGEIRYGGHQHGGRWRLTLDPRVLVLAQRTDIVYVEVADLIVCRGELESARDALDVRVTPGGTCLLKGCETLVWDHRVAKERFHLDLLGLAGVECLHEGAFGRERVRQRTCSAEGGVLQRRAFGRESVRQRKCSAERVVSRECVQQRRCTAVAYISRAAVTRVQVPPRARRAQPHSPSNHHR